MPIPYSVKRCILADKTEYTGRFPDALSRVFEKEGDFISKIEPSGFSAETRNSLFRQSYEFEFYTEPLSEKTKLCYEINLEPLLRLSIFIMFGSAFFLFLSVSEFLIYGSILTVLFYSVNLFFIQAYIQKKTDLFLGNAAHDSEEEAQLKKQQDQWKNQAYTCPACGESLTDFDFFCPECGIRIKNDRSEIPANITNYQNSTIRYTYKKTEKKDRPD